MQYTSIGLSQYQETDRVSVLEHYNRDMRTTTSYVSGIMQTSESHHQELLAETLSRIDGDSELNEKIIRNDTEINLLHDTDTELANKIETEKERITALSSTVETNKNNISDRVDNLENNITNWQNNATNLITTNSTNISNNASKIAALESGVGEQTSTITSIRSELSTTTARANENYNSIGNIWTNIGNQNNAIHDIETNISNFNSNLGAVRTQCQNNTARISVLENTGSTFNTNLYTSLSGFRTSVKWESENNNTSPVSYNIRVNGSSTLLNGRMCYIRVANPLSPNVWEFDLIDRVYYHLAQSVNVSGISFGGVDTDYAIIVNDNNGREVSFDILGVTSFAPMLINTTDNSNLYEASCAVYNVAISKPATSLTYNISSFTGFNETNIYPICPTNNTWITISDSKCIYIGCKLILRLRG